MQLVSIISPLSSCGIVLLVLAMIMSMCNRSNNDWITENSIDLESACSSSDASFQDLLALSVRMCTVTLYCAVDIGHRMHAFIDTSPNLVHMQL